MLYVRVRMVPIFFVYVVLRSLSPNPPYNFSLSMEQRQFGVELLAKLSGHSKPQMLLAFHNFLYSLIGVLIKGVDANQWLSPLTYWLAIFSMNIKRTFRAARDYTEVIAW